MPSLIIGLPVMRGQLEAECFSSLMVARRHLYENGIPHNILSNECSVISASRNGIVQMFLNTTTADLFMWVDSDIMFPQYGIKRLVDRNLDIVGGVYYHKDYMATPTIYKMKEDGRFRIYGEADIKDKPFEVDGIGTGFLLIKREVLAKFTPDVVKEMGTPFGFGFSPDGTEEGEDLSFCRRAKKLGYKIWADPTIPLGHIGRKAYTIEDFENNNMFQNWKAKKESYDNSIEGWMTKAELNWLYETAKEMDSIVEVGSWKGRSTHALLSGCKGTVYAVDTWKGSKDEQDGPHVEATVHEILPQFKENLKEFKNLEIAEMESVEAAKQFEDGSIDMVFIDGAHDYKSVKEDIEAWMPKAKKLICGHDWQWHTVQEAVTEKFGVPDQVDTIWIQKLGDTDVAGARTPSRMETLLKF